MALAGLMLFSAACNNGNTEVGTTDTEAPRIIDLSELNGYKIIRNEFEERDTVVALLDFRMKLKEQYKLDVETTYASNIHKTSAELVAKYQDQGKIRIHPNHTLKFSAEEAETIAQYQTDIDTYVKDRLAIWIVGEEEELNDDTWAAYLAQLEKMNMDKLTDAYQSAYARFFGAG